MKGKNHNYWFVLLVLICLIGGICGCRKTNQLEFEESKLISVKDEYMMSAGDDENFFFISKDSGNTILIPNQYVIDYYLKLDRRYVVGTSNSINQIETYEAYVLDIHTLRMIKTIDVASVLEPYMEEYQIFNGGFGLGEIDGRYYLIQSIEQRKKEEDLQKETENIYKSLWIDIETEATIVKEDDTGRLSYTSDDNENIWMLEGTLILKANGYEGTHVRNSGYLKDTSYIRIPTKYLPEKNAKLYSLFPELKGVSREEGVYAHIYLSPRTNNLEAISLILEEDEDLDFSLLEAKDGYYGNYRIKGELHYIAKEEYEQFQKEYWEYREQERAEAE